MATERNPYDMKPEELGNVVPMAAERRRNECYL